MNYGGFPRIPHDVYTAAIRITKAAMKQPQGVHSEHWLAQVIRLTIMASSAVGIRAQILQKHYELFKKNADYNIILGKLRICGMWYHL